MRWGYFSGARLTSLRAVLAAREPLAARKATHIGSRIPADKRPPDVYRRGARGWTLPWHEYPQEIGVVVAIEDDEHTRLSPADRARFPLTAPPAGFHEGVAADNTPRSARTP